MAASSLPAPRIFVSHSHVDNGFGVRLVNDLRQALGDESSVWYDAHGGLYGGDPWWSKIVSELSACHVFIIVLSPEAVSSKWVNDEINLAWLQRNKTGKHIIPVLYRKCEVPEYLNIVQIISFLPPKAYGEAFNELLKALGLAAQPVSKLKERIPILTPIRDFASSTIKRVSNMSKERMIQVAALLFIAAGIILSSIWLNQSVTTANMVSASQTAMATAIATHYPFSNHEALYDSLANTNQHDKWGWNTNTGSEACQLTHQGSVVTESHTDQLNPCFAGKTNFKNFTYEVTMTISEGDCGALLFRVNAAQSGYLFGICQDGYYFLKSYKDGFDTVGSYIKDYSPSGFNVGLNYPISVGIVARGSTISLCINGTFIDHVTDSVYNQGQIGIAAYSFSNPTEVLFSNAKVWML
jgi:hypothetical protein